MLVYSKLYDLLKGKLKCTIKDLYGVNDALRFIYFTTPTENVSCLLDIGSKHQVKMDMKKFLSLVRWKDNEIGFDAILAGDQDTTIVKEIKAGSSPHGFIEMIKRIAPSLVSIPYRVAVMTEEHLLVLASDERDATVDVFHIRGPKEAKLMVVLDLETLIFKNIIPELERVHRNIFKLIQDTNNEYHDLLLSLLKRCHDLKIISTGRAKTQTMTALEQNVKINMAHKAVKLALECFEDLERKQPTTS